MGFGDTIMATAQIRVVAQATGQKVTLGYEDEVLDNNPFVAAEGEQAVILDDRPGHRPYILGSDGERLIWNPRHRACPGEIYLSEEEQTPIEGNYVVIEPNVKGTVSGPNKDWGFDRWQAVADKLGIRLVQMRGPYLKGVESCETKSFREACAVLAGSQGYIGNEGGLHHAAAAFRLPAVVVFGGYIHPNVTGYEFHNNLGGDWCGMLAPCDHCRKKLDEIEVEEVLAASKGISGLRLKAGSKLSGGGTQRGGPLNGSGQRNAVDPGTTPH